MLREQNQISSYINSLLTYGSSLQGSLVFGGRKTHLQTARAARPALTYADMARLPWKCPAEDPPSDRWFSHTHTAAPKAACRAFSPPWHSSLSIELLCGVRSESDVDKDLRQVGRLGQERRMTAFQCVGDRLAADGTVDRRNHMILTG